MGTGYIDGVFFCFVFFAVKSLVIWVSVFRTDAEVRSLIFRGFVITVVRWILRMMGL